MGQPDWFILIERWRGVETGLGGITLPFLVGALALKAGKAHVDGTDVAEVLDQIRSHPVHGYVIQVRWCVELSCPVFSAFNLRAIYEPMPFKSGFKGPNNEDTLVFSDDLHYSRHLNCTNEHDCYDKLIQHATEHVEQDRFSINRNSNTLEYEFGPFSESDQQYIKSALGIA